MSLSFSDLGGKIIAAVATGCVIGGGTVVLTGARENAVQQEQIDRNQSDIEKVGEKLDNATREMQKMNENLARLLGREEARNRDR